MLESDEDGSLVPVPSRGKIALSEMERTSKSAALTVYTI